MTQPDLATVALTRPATDAPGPLDERLYDLVEERFRRLLRDHPPFATFVGIHADDDRLGDGTVEAVTQEMDDERRHLAAVEAIDPAGLSDDAKLERDLEIHNLQAVGLRRRGPSDLGAAVDGDGQRRRRTLRDLRAGLRVRCPSGSPRSPAASRRRRATSRNTSRGRSDRRSGCGRNSRSQAAEEMPGLFDEIATAAAGALGEKEKAPTRPCDRPRQGGRRRVRGLAPRVAGTCRRRLATWPRRPTTSSSGCAPSTAWTPTPSSRSARSSWPRTRQRASGQPGRSTRPPTSRRSSGASRTTIRRHSRRRSRHTATSCGGRASTSSIATS